MPDTFHWLLSHGIRFYRADAGAAAPACRACTMCCRIRARSSYHLEKAARRAGVDIRCGDARHAAAGAGERPRHCVDCDGRRQAAALPGARRHHSGHRRLHQRSGTQGALHGPARSQVRRRQHHRHRRRAKAGAGARRAHLNGDLALGPELRFVPPLKREMLLLNLPPWPLLANLMAWSLDNLPSALLRPFVMSFVTTALAPSPALFEAGALLVNKAASASATSATSRPMRVPEQPGKIAYILLDARLAKRSTPGRISSRPRPASPMPMSTTTGATGLTYSRAAIRSKRLPASSACRPAHSTKPRAPTMRRPTGEAAFGDGSLHCARPGPRRVRACGRRTCGRSTSPRPGCGRSPHRRPLCGRLHRARRPVAQRARPPPRLGLRLRAARRAQRRPRHHVTTSSLTGDVTTIKTRSVRPVLVIACSTPGGK